MFAVVYMLVRIAINVSTSVQPFFLIECLGFHPTSTNPTPLQLAIVPLVNYFCSVIFSLFIYKPLIQCARNRFVPMFIGVIVVIIGFLPMLFITIEYNYLIYVFSGVQGFGLAILQNTASSLISDVIGKNDQTSAFVYGAYSFGEKVLNGILLFVVTANFTSNATALMYIYTFVPIFCAIVSFALTYLGKVLYSERLARISTNILA
jgi:Na+/melibiose symporter-like transporter